VLVSVTVLCTPAPIWPDSSPDVFKWSIDRTTVITQDWSADLHKSRSLSTWWAYYSDSLLPIRRYEISSMLRVSLESENTDRRNP
jgi:hypothetical protein